MQPLKQVLIHDNEYMVRKTFAMFAQETRLAIVDETSDLSLAKENWPKKSFDAIIMGFYDWSVEYHLIELVRANMTKSAPDIPIITLMPNITADQIHLLKTLEVSEIMLKPSRIKSIQSALKTIWSMHLWWLAPMRQIIPKGLLLSHLAVGPKCCWSMHA